MSRSYKKISVFKDGGHENKKIASRRLRRAVKDAVHHNKEVMPISSEHTNPYDICDWKSFPSKKDKDYNRGKRK